MVKKKETRVGMIGYSIGKVHAHAWLNVNQFYMKLEGVPKLVAVCGRNQEAVKSFAANYSVERTYGEWSEMLNDSSLDVLDNCAPPNVHVEPCIKAAEKGIAVFCEKPLARHAEEAYGLYQGVKKTGALNMTGFNKRFSPAVLYAKELVESGRLGRINHVVATCYNIQTGEGFASPSIPLLWMFRKEIGGHGALADVGSHVVDLCRFLVGEITTVSGATETFVHERSLQEDPTTKGKVDVEDLAVGCLRFANGALGTLNITWSQVSARDWAVVEVYGTKGSFRYNFERPNELELFLQDDDMNSFGFRNVICDSRTHPLASNFWPDQGGSYGFEQTFVSEIGHFLTALEEDRKTVEPLGASFYDGYVVCLINDELIASAKDRKWHRVEPRAR